MPEELSSASMSKPERVSSRLIKKERSKLLKQTIWFVGGGIILVLAFLFFVLPNFIRALNAVLDTNPIVEEDTVIIQAPDLVAPVSATFSAQLQVAGIGTAGTKTVLVVNGAAGPEVPTADDGKFTSTVDLTEGDNEITAYSVDINGNESKSGRSYFVTLDTTAPKLEVTEPQEGQEFESKQSSITVSGKTEPNTKVYLNDRFFLPKADGSFSTTFSLNQGETVLKIKAVDEAGNHVELERKVKRK